MAKFNINYGKIVDDKIVYSPNKLVVGDVQIFNASEEQYFSQGYLPIIRTNMPENNEDNGYYSSVYIEENNQIIQNWNFNEYNIEDV